METTKEMTRDKSKPYQDSVRKLKHTVNKVPPLRGLPLSRRDSPLLTVGFSLRTRQYLSVKSRRDGTLLTVCFSLRTEAGTGTRRFAGHRQRPIKFGKELPVTGKVQPKSGDDLPGTGEDQAKPGDDLPVTGKAQSNSENVCRAPAKPNQSPGTICRAPAKPNQSPVTICRAPAKPNQVREWFAGHRQRPAKVQEK